MSPVVVWEQEGHRVVVGQRGDVSGDYYVTVERESLDAMGERCWVRLDHHGAARRDRILGMALRQLHRRAQP